MTDAFTQNGFFFLFILSQQTLASAHYKIPSSNHDEWPSQSLQHSQGRTQFSTLIEIYRRNDYGIVCMLNIKYVWVKLSICDLYAFVAKTDFNCLENGLIEHLALKWITHLGQPKVNKMNFASENICVRVCAGVCIDSSISIGCAVVWQ